jgi:hypothetical protein
LADEDDDHLEYTQLAAYVDGTLSEAVRKEIETHMAVCSSCAADAASLAQVARHLPFGTRVDTAAPSLLLKPQRGLGPIVVEPERTTPALKDRVPHSPVRWWQRPRYAWVTPGLAAATVLLATYATMLWQDLESARTLAEVEQALAQSQLALSEAESSRVRTQAELSAATAELARARTAAQQARAQRTGLASASPEPPSAHSLGGTPEQPTSPSERPPATTAAAAPATDAARVRMTIAEYERAAEALDFEGVRRIWPAAPDGLRNHYRNLVSETVDLNCGEPAITSDTATISCEEQIRSVGAGGITLPVATNTVMFSLRRNGDAWEILRISRQPAR